MLSPEAVFLGDACKAEGLAGKAAAENIELRDVGHGHGMDVAVRHLAEIGGVRLLAELVPVAGEDAFPASPLEGEAESANTAEEIYEAQVTLGIGSRGSVLDRILTQGGQTFVVDSGSIRFGVASSVFH